MMAKWPRVETTLDGMGLRPGTGYIPLECSWSGLEIVTGGQQMLPVEERR